jgi:hypothetical protein
MTIQLTATQLRANLFRTLDQVAATGEAISIERPAGTLRIVPAHTSRLGALKPHPGIITGDAADLAELSWEGSWQPTI